MKQYVSAIAVDFGSTNSGCARIYDRDNDGKVIFQSSPDYIQALTNYVKDNTWFFVSPDFLRQMTDSYDRLADSDFRIESRVMHNTNPNIIWTRETISRYSEKLTAEGWIGFKQFKMLLYKDAGTMVNGCPLVNVIKTFLRILKIECLSVESGRLGRTVTADEIEWGLTIPSIWSDANKKVMVDIVQDVFSPQARVLSEPEGPLISNLLYSCGNSNVPYRDGRTSLVVDLGGGTTDICLMKEVCQKNGAYKFEMLDYTDGTAAGGNDIDHDFFVYLLRKISVGHTSDAGVSYDSLSDDELLKELLYGFSKDVDGFIELENNWLRLKDAGDLTRRSVCDFTFTKGYRRWLKYNGHMSIAADMTDYLCDGCELPSNEVIDRVLRPTFDRICKKVESIILANRGSHNIDKVVLAGGLSLNQMLVSRIKATVADILGSNNMVLTTPGAQAGAAILWGSCYLLVAGDFIMRKARRNYYYDVYCSHTNAINTFIDEYKAFGVTMRIGEVSQLEDDEIDKGYKVINSDNNVLMLSPIALKGMPVKNISREIFASEGQKSINVALYSTDGTKVFFANPANPYLKKEGEINIECNGVREFIVEADINEGTIANAVRCYIKDAKTGCEVCEPFILEEATSTSISV